MSHPRKHLHRTLKHYFIPHRANHYHPHILHTKQVVRSTVFFLALKVLLVGFALLIPAEAFVAPDVLAEQGQKIVAMTNEVRKQNGLPELHAISPLRRSAQARVEDMNEKQYFSHVSPDGHGVSYFVRWAGYDYSTTGENLAMGFSDADSVMSAWMKSPSHYANLIDKEYEDFGIGLVGGVYNGKPTVFIAQHFGLPYRALPTEPAAPVTPPKVKPAPTPSGPNADGQAIALAPTSAPVHAAVTHSTRSVQVVSAPVKPASTPIAPAVRPTAPVVAPVNSPVVTRAALPIPPPTPIAIAPTAPVIPAPQVVPTVHSVDPYDGALSYMTWTDLSSQRTRLDAHVIFHGPVTQASVSVDGYTIQLTQRVGEEYAGSLVVPETSNDLFRVVIPPTIRLTTIDGVSYEGIVEWQHPKVVSDTPWQRYRMADSWLSGSIPVFNLVRGIYLVGLIFFAIALALNIFIEFRKQHAHVIVKTAALLILLVALIRY